MIRHAEGEHLPLLLDFLARDSLGVKIAGALLAYGLSVRFADFWFQLDRNGKILSVIGRLDTALTLCAHPRLSRDRDALEELELFFHMLPEVDSLTAPEGLPLDFPFTKRGVTLEFFLSGEAFSPKPNPELLSPISASALYALLSGCHGPAMELPPRAAFLVDFSHRLRHGVSRCWWISDGTLASAVFTSAEMKARALIGGVATRPDCRGRGYASRLLRTACETLSSEGKTPSLFCLESELDFYQARGFTLEGRWATAKFT